MLIIIKGFKKKISDNLVTAVVLIVLDCNYNDSFTFLEMTFITVLYFTKKIY